MQVRGLLQTAFPPIQTDSRQVGRVTKRCGNFDDDNSFTVTVDTLTTLRQMALSANQSFSPSFIRALVKDKGVSGTRSFSWSPGRED